MLEHSQNLEFSSLDSSWSCFSKAFSRLSCSSTRLVGWNMLEILPILAPNPFDQFTLCRFLCGSYCGREEENGQSKDERWRMKVNPGLGWFWSRKSARMSTWCLLIGSWPLTLIFDGGNTSQSWALSLGQQWRLQLKRKWASMQRNSDFSYIGPFLHVPYKFWALGP